MTRTPRQLSTPAFGPNFYRRILGVRFFVGRAPHAVKAGVRGGLVVAPAAPALLDLATDPEYRKALLECDLAITDSGFLVLLWNMLTWDRIHRVSGLEYLKMLLRRPEFRQRGSVVWVMPTAASRERTLAWLRTQGYPVELDDFYLAPMYPEGTIEDQALADMVNRRQPDHVIVGIGGGAQERLGLCLKQRCAYRPAIHCIGAAIGFLTGDQVSIPDWADRWVLGWLFRCVSNPRRFVPRYVKAFKLALVLWRHGSRMPELQESLIRN